MRSADRPSGLHEQDRLGRDRGPGLLGMVGVVEADREHVPRPGHRGAEPGAGGRVGQGVGVGGQTAQGRQPAAREECVVVVADVCRDVLEPASGGHDTGLLLTTGSKADEFHRDSFRGTGEGD